MHVGLRQGLQCFLLFLNFLFVFVFEFLFLFILYFLSYLYCYYYFNYYYSYYYYLKKNITCVRQGRAYWLRARSITWRRHDVWTAVVGTPAWTLSLGGVAQVARGEGYAYEGWERMDSRPADGACEGSQSWLAWGVATNGVPSSFRAMQWSHQWCINSKFGFAKPSRQRAANEVSGVIYFDEDIS